MVVLRHACHYDGCWPCFVAAIRHAAASLGILLSNLYESFLFGSHWHDHSHDSKFSLKVLKVLNGGRLS